MSTGQVRSGSGGPEHQHLDAFETRDFYPVCFVRYTGYELLNLLAEGRPHILITRESCGARTALSSPIDWGDELTARAGSFRQQLDDALLEFVRTLRTAIQCLGGCDAYQAREARLALPRDSARTSLAIGSLYAFF